MLFIVLSAQGNFFAHALFLFWLLGLIARLQAPISIVLELYGHSNFD